MQELIRPATFLDLDGLFELASIASLGLTGLPKNRAILEEKIHHSLHSFSKRTPHPKLFLFVLEDTKTKRIIGTCQITSRSGYPGTSYFYKVFQEEDQTLIKPIRHQKGPTEIKGLFLHPEYRQGNRGKLLSYCRFFFIANVPKEFTETIVAEMRGFIDEKDESPFWNGVGRHFCNLSLKEALDQSIKNGAFIPFILPKYPLYVKLLPKAAQEALGRTHPSKDAALRLLEQEGFSFTHEVDIFDGGPKVSAKKSAIRTLKESTVAPFECLKEAPLETFMVSNLQRNFKAVVTGGRQKEGCLLLPQETIQLLSLSKEDHIRYIPY